MDKEGKVFDIEQFRKKPQAMPEVVDGARKQEESWPDPADFLEEEVEVTMVFGGGSEKGVKLVKYPAKKEPGLSGQEFLMREMQKLVEQKEDILVKLRAGHPVRFMIDDVWVECRPIYKFAAKATGPSETKVEVSLPWYWKLWSWLNSFIRNEDNESNSKKSEACEQKESRRTD